jgi:alanyl-tRNA synthetase
LEVVYVTAKSPFDYVGRRFEQFGFPLYIERNLIPDDDTTLFVCSGMQNLKYLFQHADGSRHGSLQSCVRVNDLDLIGDGTHLTYFEMLGNFSFGGNEYELSVELWDSIICDLSLPVTYVTYHPSQEDHHNMWKKRGYTVRPDEECVWSDGNVGGYCCEVFCGDLEIGNLVNPMGHSTDVGFGWERLIQVYEGWGRVDETSLFRQDLSPVERDHVRTMESFYNQGIKPGGKGRNFICRKLLRRLTGLPKGFIFDEWLEQERELQIKKRKLVERMRKRNGDKSPEWWYETHGVLPEDMYW